MAKHSGAWSYHDDDCMCAVAGGHCNRAGYVGSCCGSCVKRSACSAPSLHPTHWNHPDYGSAPEAPEAAE